MIVFEPFRIDKNKKLEEPFSVATIKKNLRINHDYDDVYIEYIIQNVISTFERFTNQFVFFTELSFYFIVPKEIFDKKEDIQLNCKRRDYIFENLFIANENNLLKLGHKSYLVDNTLINVLSTFDTTTNFVAKLKSTSQQIYDVEHFVVLIKIIENVYTKGDLSYVAVIREFLKYFGNSVFI